MAKHKHEVNMTLKARDEASKNFNKVSRSGLNMAQTLKSAAATVGVAFGTVGIFRVFKGIVSAGSEAEETVSKFNAVFKDQARAADIFGGQLAEAVGRGKTELKGYLATLQDTFVPLGFARKEARLMSQEMVQLAIDLASFNNTADVDTIRDLQSAIVGNHETMRKYGVIITQATLDQELLNMGFDKGAKNATEQMKAQARLNIIMKGTTDAQGDAARTSGSFANQWKRLRSNLKEAGITISKFFLPPLTSMLEKLNNLSLETAESAVGVAAWVASIGGVIWLAPKIIKSIKLVVAGIGAVTTASTTMQALAGPKAWVTLAIGMGVAAASATLIAQKFAKLRDELDDTNDEADDLVTLIKEIPDAAGTATKSITDMADAMKKAKERSAGIKKVNDEFDALKKKIEDFGKTEARLLADRISRAHELEPAKDFIFDEVKAEFDRLEALKKSADQAERYTDFMKDMTRELITFGKTAQQVQIFDLLNLGLTKEQTADAMWMVNQLHDLQDEQKRRQAQMGKPTLSLRETRLLTLGPGTRINRTEENTGKMVNLMKKTNEKLNDIAKAVMGTEDKMPPGLVSVRASNMR
jgi:predicted translin family RNA/ssDNA-binding protein